MEVDVKRKYVYGLAVLIVVVILGSLASTCRSSGVPGRIEVPQVDQTEARASVAEAMAAGEQVNAIVVSLQGAKTDLESIPLQVKALPPEAKVTEGERLFGP